MLRTTGLALVILLAGGSASANAQALHELQSPQDITWRSKPTAQDMANFYPAKAQRAEQAGWAVLECRTATTGEMKNCQLLGEGPVGFDFGAAGLRLSSKFKIDASKTDPTLLESGVVTIPIFMVTPTGAPPPPRDYLAGQPAALVTIALNKAKGDFPCPSAAAPDRQCRSHALKWRKSPSLAEGAAQVRAANATSGRSSLQCRIQVDYHLTSCGTAEADPQRKAAMLALSATLIAPEKADDETPTSGNIVVIDFNWAALRNAVETSVFAKLP
ncbi:hypothetical protein CA606_18005 [Caulobacter vibrioides]|uniref:TonB C-terminal domain-containing protein n=1 Tax=Caulobacter vibrioides TaxID=155892 RepID=A0A290MW03_CAUVI|nr:hypothetical protein [Caulobacter vibrioides]ATC34072.1 hypothetical protein CA606_18005 [Caulobacter vibrioides]